MSESVPTSRAEDEQDSDASLLLRLAARDEQAMSLLFARHSRLVYSVALRVLSDSGKAQDILQEIFLQIWQKPPVLAETQKSIGSWLAITTRNRCIDVIRRTKPNVSAETVTLASPINFGQAAEQRILIDRVRAIASDMPVEQQTVLDLAFFEGLTHVEIAAQTGVPLGTVKTRIRAAVSALGKAMRT